MAVGISVIKFAKEGYKIKVLAKNLHTQRKYSILLIDIAPSCHNIFY